jgi:uncharacterized protein (TIGR02996 family)
MESMALLPPVCRPPDALIEALRLDIEDDTAWQVLADWLFDRADPRGELIMAELQLERDGPANAPLAARVRALRQAYSDRWRESLSPPPQTRLLVRCGFVVGVRLRPWDPQRQAFLRRLLDHPVGALVHSVEVHHSALDDDAARRVMHEAAERLNMPVVDPVRTGVEPLVDRLLSDG